MNTLTTVFRALALIITAILSGLAGPSALGQCGGRWLTSPEQVPPGTFGFVSALVAMPNGDIVAGGFFQSIGGVNVNYIARWNGSSWAPLGTGVGLNGQVKALAVLLNGDLVAGGDFTTADGVPVNYIARWNGSSWTPLGGGLQPGLPSNVVRAMAVMPNGDLVVGGSFFTAGGVQGTIYIARWNGSSWSPLVPGGNSSSPNGPVNALVVLPNGNLVVGGDFPSIGSFIYNYIARTDGSTWFRYGLSPNFGVNAVVQAVAVLPNGSLVAGGDFTTAGGVAVNRIARWNGSSWAPLGSGMNGAVRAIAVMQNGDLVAGGYFATAGGTTANGIARWNGSSWAPLGTGVNSGVIALSVLLNRELIAGGDFTTAGALPSGYWARWTETGIPWIARQPAAQTTPVLGSASFTAIPASGYDFSGPLTFQWRRNGVNIANGATANGTLLSGATTATLSLSSISILDSGRYSCVVSNSCGSATSAGVLLTVGSSACPGDATGDGLINFADLNAVLSAFGQSVATPGTGGDVTGDGAVNFADLNTVLSNFGSGC